MEKSNYLYHLKKRDLKGDTLHPLNVLKDKHPDIYAEEIKKYARGREDLTKKQVLPLGVSWSDVLHLSAVHPDKIKKALQDAGSKADLDLAHYEIDPKTLDPKDTIVYMNDSDDVEQGNFVSYNPAELEKYSSLPQATKDHYTESLAKGERPYLHHRVPHILYKGSIKIK